MSTATQSETKPAWSAVYAIGLAVAGLTSAEMLPVSLLTPIAHDLKISEGLAGQTVTATAIVALIASLFTAVATRGLDRRKLLIGLSILQVASGLLAAFAPNLPVLVLSRLLLGVSVGGFWAMSAALAMRLVPANMLGKALAVIFGGGSIATIAAAPLGSFLGGLIGWRGVFLVATVLAIAALVWQWVVLPSMPPRGHARLATLFHVLTRPKIKLGMLAVVLVFGGHFAFFTYLRPFLESVTGMGLNGVSAILLVFGIGGFVGTSLSGRLLTRSVHATLLAVPLLMTAMAAGLVMFGSVPAVVSLFIAVWGFAFGTVPVGWSTWLTQTVPDEAESAGGILVAAIQIAITAGAALGGVLFDHGGPREAFMGSGVILLVASLVICTIVRARPSVAVARSGRA
ncbi:putative MFS family arabinose efflux permease [Pseudoduganella lurida]|uniref:Putative MFS family arabinose efflux permease n=1 Tax=Pseudoduganella lurida TaxID=1036180 RepID=A0A562R0D9_9BURK|nr:MFS transporter [Pseudoduganella lurida]TWI62521.1 putative MFS family arabinose efflux permease [Pseudoduganella lurida]